MAAPYWQDDQSCACKCGGVPSPGRRFITGHNLRVMERTEAHRRAISEGQRRAWKVTQRRKPLGSTRYDHDGYILVKTAHGQVRWKKQHVLVMQEVIGRTMTPGEQVHHINGIKDANDLENLFLCDSPADHQNIEATFKQLLAGLMADGVVLFDRAERRYRRAA